MMNVYKNDRGPSRRKRHNSSFKSKGHYATLWILIFALVLVAFGFTNKAVEYSSQTEDDLRTITKINREIKQLDSEIAYLNIEKESLMSRKHIYNKIAEYKLGLREAEPQQICRLGRSDINAYAHLRVISNKSVALLR